MQSLTLVLVLTVQLTWGQSKSSIPKSMNGGGYAAYHLNISQCEVQLPKHIPAYSWGFTIYSARLILKNPMLLYTYFSTTRAVSGKPYNLTDNVLRFTQVTFINTLIRVEMADVDERTPQILARGTVKCEGLSGLKTFPQGNDLTTYKQIVNQLLAGNNLISALNMDQCSPSSSSGISWIAVISDYQFPKDGELEFTQMVDFIEKQFFLTVTVTETTVTVKSYTVFRLTRTHSKTEIKNCQLGKSLQVSINDS